MGMNTKTIMQILGVAVLILLVTAAVVKWVVMPAKLAISEKSIKISELTRQAKDLSSKLKDAKAAVLVDMDNSTVVKLVDYIDRNTTVLSDKMIKSAAHELIKASSKHNVPLDLVVGIAQATSNFNTTYMSGDGHRGILALHSGHCVKTNESEVKKLNLVDVGAVTSCRVLKKALKDNKDVSDALDYYFVSHKYSANHMTAVLRHTVAFRCFRQ